MVRILVPAALAAAMLSLPAAAQERSIYDDVKLEVIPETHGVAPYPNELVLLRIRGVYRPLVNISHMIQPSLANFGWTNLTRDTATDAEFDGFPAKAFERTLAVFPEKTGDLVIDSFVHKLTVVDGDGYRDINVKSPPITIKVATWQGPGGPKDPNQWWLPSSDVRITDQWSGDPNRVPRGETVRRTVTIEADGVTAEQLPPSPLMRSPGIISFRGPIDRETRVTETGPVARAVYRWDMRPTTAHPAIVEPIDIPWFDTKARTLRKAVIPAQRMAWAAVDAAGAPAVAKADEKPSAAALSGAGALAFLIGLGVLLVGREASSGLPKLPPRALLALRWAALRRDVAGVRAAVTRLARDEPGPATRWTGDPAVRAALAELDRHLFDASGSPAPDLGRLARTVRKARSRALLASRSKASGLAPLDGPYRGA
ncbi:BatD family protein [Methylopila sp. M107]|uniref:BatD family protein n=1 Tax=Methylopila sp. M107 TaxID=1101190 RepID=UPI0003823211|nr:BatD family protein [Methylopila sp. M107]